jgi:hypothetical protein
MFCYTVAMVMLLRDIGAYVIIFMTCSVKQLPL